MPPRNLIIFVKRVTLEIKVSCPVDYCCDDITREFWGRDYSRNLSLSTKRWTRHSQRRTLRLEWQHSSFPKKMRTSLPKRKYADVNLRKERVSSSFQVPLLHYKWIRILVYSSFTVNDTRSSRKETRERKETRGCQTDMEMTIISSQCLWSFMQVE